MIATSPHVCANMPWKPRRDHAGNLGDVVRPVALKRLLASVAPPNQCFWYAHPWAEDPSARQQYTAQFSNGDVTRLVPISTDYAEEVILLYFCNFGHTVPEVGGSSPNVEQRM